MSIFEVLAIVGVVVAAFAAGFFIGAHNVKSAASIAALPAAIKEAGASIADAAKKV